MLQPVYSTIKRNTAWNDPEINSVHLNQREQIKIKYANQNIWDSNDKENPVEQKLCLFGSEIIWSRLDSGGIKFTKNQCFQEGTYVFPCSPRRFEQQGRPASREASQHQRELELRWWRLGGNQHLHRKEEGLRDAIAALQALAVCPLAEATAAGETLRAEPVKCCTASNNCNMKNSGLITWIYKPALLLMASRGWPHWFLFYRALWENYPLHTWLVHSVNTFMMGLWY